MTKNMLKYGERLLYTAAFFIGVLLALPPVMYYLDKWGYNPFEWLFRYFDFWLSH